MIVTTVQNVIAKYVTLQRKMMELLTVEQSATDKLKELIAEEDNPKLKLRIFVQGGGCSGFQYGFTFDEDVAEDDYSIDAGDGVGILVDHMSAEYLKGATIKFTKDLMSQSFAIVNPNATATCGCGSSFNA
jgi:iron-sulfur cluster insertion protein